MLQQNSFFSSPFIFFGSHQDSYEIDPVDGEGDLSQPLYISLNPMSSNHPLPKIGLCLLWSPDLYEE